MQTSDVQPARPAGAPRPVMLTVEFTAAANLRLPARMSARSGPVLWQRLAVAAAAAALLVGAIAAPLATLSALLAGLSLVVAATTLLRALVLFASRPWPDPAPEPSPPRDPPPTPPRLGLIVALRREAEVLPVLLSALDALDYPRDRLRVALAIEDDDPETLRAAETLLADAAAVPNAREWIEIIVLPEGGPRTKPRALNAVWAHFETAPNPPELIGVFDAEDRPDPTMLRRAAAALTDPDPTIACAQARLGYFNASENWLSRCFAMEYATWFDVTLKGLRAIDAPIPLGGSSVFIRADALRALSGWDAHNVTEDADLGLRLSREGYRCRLIDVTTLEEAACRPGAWVRQRSRWLKGYLQTWISISRRPLAELRAFGPGRYLAAQIILLGGPVSALAQPIVLGAALGAGLGYGAALAAALGPVAPFLVGVLAIGQAVVLASAFIGLARTRQWRLAWWTPTLFFYWPLAALAAYKALIELFFAPFYWDKTAHGRGPFAARLRREALSRWGADAAAQSASKASSLPDRSRE